MTKPDRPRKPINVERARAKRAGLSTSDAAGGAPSTKKKAKRKGKYNASGEYVDGQWCASKAEAMRYRQLLKLQEEGRIANLECQPPFKIVINNKLVCKYVADFRYDVTDDRMSVLYNTVEDVKGMITPIYRLKKKLIEAHLQQSVIEIPGGEVPAWEGRVAPRP